MSDGWKKGAVGWGLPDPEVGTLPPMPERPIKVQVLDTKLDKSGSRPFLFVRLNDPMTGQTWWTRSANVFGREDLAWKEFVHRMKVWGGELREFLARQSYGAPAPFGKELSAWAATLFSPTPATGASSSATPTG